ncbi:MAG TPA: polysaccharide deacetylase family protein [Candidatus Dormibacteraeota bacterium]|nr:polysaccharide deacetylase family protein [Candidatus Dormibacteraeota bacterium]
MRQWLADRPALVALSALLAPALISLVGFGFAALIPDVKLATESLPQLSTRLPLLAPQDVPPLPPTRPDQLVPPGRPQVRVPILEYHYIRVNPDPRDRLGFNLSVTPSDFAEQMDWLRASGYHPIDLNDLRAYFHDQAPLPARPVVLTFDDGYDDFYTTAFPILQAHEFKAVSYVVPGFLDHPRYMTSDQVRTIDAGGVEVAAHTMHHVDLSKASPAELTLEIQGSRSALEQLVGHPVLDFCYPSGKYNDAVVAATDHAGFQSATTEVAGVGHRWANRLTWPRVRVNGGERMEQFVASLGEPESTVAPSPDV